MKQISVEYCTRCQFKSESDLLREIAYSEHRSLQDLLRKARYSLDSSIHRESAKHKDRRLEDNREKLQQYEQKLRQLEEKTSLQTIDSILQGEEVDDIQGEEIDDIDEGMLQSADRQELENKIRSLKRVSEDIINEEDIKQALEGYARCGYIEIQQGKVMVTSKGTKRLAASALERILKNLIRKEVGSHPIERVGFGVELSPHTRRYEVGDDYFLVDTERTSLNALSRSGRLKFEPEDFEMREEIHQSKLCAALIIDESDSMRHHHKLEAAMETALVLSQLIAREPEISLKIFVFSDKVKQIEPWAIVNEVLSGGDTDIRAALRAFRKASKNEQGDKQAYLITDAEPNTEDGRHIPFDRAIAIVTEEALRYRQEKIGLNIIMLDENPQLKSLASTLAKRNLGRVFFTSPFKLGQVMVEDYLKGGREGFFL